MLVFGVGLTLLSLVGFFNCNVKLLRKGLIFYVYLFLNTVLLSRVVFLQWKMLLLVLTFKEILLKNKIELQYVQVQIIVSPRCVQRSRAGLSNVLRNKYYTNIIVLDSLVRVEFIFGLKGSHAHSPSNVAEQLRPTINSKERFSG